MELGILLLQKEAFVWESKGADTVTIIYFDNYDNTYLKYLKNLEIEKK